MGKGGAMGVAKIKLGASLPALGMTSAVSKPETTKPLLTKRLDHTFGVWPIMNYSCSLCSL